MKRTDLSHPVVSKMRFLLSLALGTMAVALMVLAFGVVIVAASYVFAVTAEREPEQPRRSHWSSSPRQHSSSR